MSYLKDFTTSSGDSSKRADTYVVGTKEGASTPVRQQKVVKVSSERAFIDADLVNYLVSVVGKEYSSMATTLLQEEPSLFSKKISNIKRGYSADKELVALRSEVEKNIERAVGLRSYLKDLSKNPNKQLTIVERNLIRLLTLENSARNTPASTGVPLKATIDTPKTADSIYLGYLLNLFTVEKDNSVTMQTIENVLSSLYETLKNPEDKRVLFEKVQAFLEQPMSVISANSAYTEEDCIIARIVRGIAGKEGSLEEEGKVPFKVLLNIALDIYFTHNSLSKYEFVIFKLHGMIKDCNKKGVSIQHSM